MITSGTTYRPSWSGREAPDRSAQTGPMTLLRDSPLEASDIPFEAKPVEINKMLRDAYNIIYMHAIYRIYYRIVGDTQIIINKVIYIYIL